MTRMNDQTTMTNKEPMTKHPRSIRVGHWALGFCCSLVLGHSAVYAQPIDIWLDVDTANGYESAPGKPHDVDDGLAMIQVFHSPEVKLHGVSVQFGNAPLEPAVKIAREIAAKFGPKDLVVASGAATKDDLEKETDATLALADALQQRPLDIIALGPVTNVASVVKHHPELKSKIRRIYVCAARRVGFGFHPPGRPELLFPDANFEKDPAAMQILLDSGIPITFAGYEVSCDTWLTRDDLNAMAAKSEVGKWIATTSDAWLSRWEARKQVGFNPFDTLTVAALTHPQFIESMPVKVHITDGPDERAAGSLAATKPVKPYLVAEPSKDGQHTYCTRAMPEFVEMLKARLVTGG
jgi:pyrimidine-specific ribonucleoside hydrolase